MGREAILQCRLSSTGKENHTFHFFQLNLILLSEHIILKLCPAWNINTVPLTGRDLKTFKVCTFRYLPPPITHTTCTQTYPGLPDTCTPLSEHTPRYSLPHRPTNCKTLPHSPTTKHTHTHTHPTLDHATITDSSPTNTKLHAFTRTLPDTITAH